MKQIIKDYQFDKDAKTVTFTKLRPVHLERIMLVTNITVGVILYQANDPTTSGTVRDNALRLKYDTTNMHNKDELQIIYDVQRVL